MINTLAILMKINRPNLMRTALCDYESSLEINYDHTGVDYQIRGTWA